MSYEVLEKQIKALPEQAFSELANYIEYLTFRYAKKDEGVSVKNKINEFLEKNPNAFEEFKTIENAGVSSIRELTKNDSW